MDRKIVYDLETQRGFDEVEGRRLDKLGVSVLVAYDYSDNEYKVFREHELNRLWPLFESADLIIGFNQKSFDNRVLGAYYRGDLSLFPHLDLLEEFYKTAGFRVRLDALGQATLNARKSGSGLQAISWFKQGNFKDLEEYCREDVALTKNLYEYALANRSLKYKELNEIKEIQLNTDDWERRTARAVNYTLPF